MPDRTCSLDIRDSCPIEARKGCDGCSSYITLEEYGKLVRGESNETGIVHKCAACGHKWSTTSFARRCPECGVEYEQI